MKRAQSPFALTLTCATLTCAWIPIALLLGAMGCSSSSDSAETSSEQGYTLDDVSLPKPIDAWHGSSNTGDDGDADGEATTVPAQPSPARTLLQVELAEDDPDFACGFATISMIAHYYDRTIPEEIASDIRETVDKNGGLHGDQLSRYFEKLGFHAVPTHGLLRASYDSEKPRSLLTFLANERPVVVLMRHPQAMRNHFGVIVGHDPARNEVALIDPGLGLTWMSYDGFEASWRFGRQFMLVPIPAKEVAW